LERFISQSLFDAIKYEKNPELVQLLLLKTSVDVNQKKYHKAPLYTALELEEVEKIPQLVTTLINYGADINLKHNFIKYNRYDGSVIVYENCFHKFIDILPNLKCNPLELLSYFRDHGANPNEMSIETVSGGTRQYSPLHSLMVRNDIDSVKLLLNAQANVNYLLEKKAFLPGYNRTTFHTVLHYAIQSMNLEMVKLLIEWKADININYKTIGIEDPPSTETINDSSTHEEEITCLHLAIESEEKELIRYLILMGANPFIDYKTREKQLTTWELCGDINEEFLQLIHFQFAPNDYLILPEQHKITLRILLLCNQRNNWNLPKDVLFKIFTYVIFM